MYNHNAFINKNKNKYVKNFEKKFSTRKKLAIFTIFLALIFLSMSSVNAATVNADINSDLQDIVNNQLDGGISDTNTINMADGDYDVYNKNFHISVNKNVNFIGSTNTRVIGNNQDYLFYVQSGWNVSFVNITFINGNGSNIYAAGAISSQGTLKVENCKFYNNTGQDGGAIRSDSSSTVYIINSEFINNSANVGGGICVVNSGLTIENSNFVNNSATDSGGAIYLTINQVLNISSSNFTNNSANANGGVIFTQNESSVFIDNGRFNDNNAIYGAAILTSPNSIINISNSSFDNNNATDKGTIYITDGGNFTVNNSNFTNNKADSYDGGVVIVAGNSPLGYIFNSKFENNKNYYITTNAVGALVLGNGNLTVVGSVFNNNSAYYAGAAIHVYNSNFTLIDSNFTNNTANLSAGAVMMDYTNYSISGSNFNNNQVTGDPNYDYYNSGGAVYAGQHSSGTINHSNFTNNRAINSGGALVIDYDNSFYINYCNFDNNSITRNNTYSSGGAVFIGHETNGTINGSNFTNNQALLGLTYIDPNLYGGGGAIGGSSRNNINITYSRFNNNGAIGYGGAIYFGERSNTAVENSEFTNNNASNDGGAIFYGDSDDPNEQIIFNSNFTANNATRGGAVFISSENNASIFNSSFKNNGAINNGSDPFMNYDVNNSGGAIFVDYDSNIIILSSDFVANIAKDYGGAIFVIGSTSGSYYGSNLTLNYNRLVNNTDKDDKQLYSENASVNASLNWWGDNRNPLIFYVTSENTTLIIDNYFLANFTNNTAIAFNGFTSFNYSFFLNDSSVSYDVSKLPYFNGDITTNVSGNYGSFDARNDDNEINVSLNLVPQIVEYKFVIDNQVFLFNLTIKSNTSVTVNSPNGTVNETIKILANVTINNLNVPVSGGNVSFYLVSSNGTKIFIGTGAVNNNGIAILNYKIINKGVFEVLAIFNGNNFYYTSNNSTQVNFIAKNTTLLSTKIDIKIIKSKNDKKIHIEISLKSQNIGLSSKKLLITINSKKYQLKTNNKGIAIINLVDLKSGKYNVKASFNGDNSYSKSQATKSFNVKPYVDLAILKVKKVKNHKNPKISKYIVTIKNLGTIKSKKTQLKLWHIRKGIKIKSKFVNIKPIASGKKFKITVTYYADRDYHKHCKSHEFFVLNPKKNIKELTYKNNKKIL